MPRMTNADLIAYNARRMKKDDDTFTGDNSVSRESDLHQHVAARCRANGWLYFHGSMAHRTRRTPGEPDFVILADGGVTLLVECKSATGKVSPEQLAVIAMAIKLGHHAMVISSVEEWETIESVTRQHKRTKE